MATADYTAILVVAASRRKRFILDVINEHLDVAAMEAEIRRLRNKYCPITAVLVEGAANGPALIERLRLSLPGVQEINPKGGKESRMNIAAAEWQAHDWRIDRRAGWAESFVEQITTFPSGRYDDMVDAMTQAACWLASYQFPTVESRNAFTGELNWSFNSGVWRAYD